MECAPLPMGTPVNAANCGARCRATVFRNMPSAQYCRQRDGQLNPPAAEFDVLAFLPQIPAALHLAPRLCRAGPASSGSGTVRGAHGGLQLVGLYDLPIPKAGKNLPYTMARSFPSRGTRYPTRVPGRPTPMPDSGPGVASENIERRD